MDGKLKKKLEKKAGIYIVEISEGLWSTQVGDGKSNTVTIYFDKIFEQDEHIISLELKGEHIVDFNIF